MVKKSREIDLEQACELASALADGHLRASEIEAALEALAHRPEARLRWQEYHLVGEVMRTGPAGATPGSDLAFVERLQQRLLAETNRPLVSATPARMAGRQSANDARWRWRLVGGVLSLAALALVGWQLAVPGFREAATPQLALAPGAPAPMLQSPGPRPAPDASKMIRDPRLDELIAAHQQMGGASALQMPAGFLRNATFERPLAGGGR